jgi:DNA repair protein SbcD/Mre11
MKLLHTSDWHLGKTLYGKKRYDEFEQFLDWLAALVVQEGITALLVAGDVFDTAVPSNRSLELYYQFLGRIAHTGCRHIVVTAGNHDSPSLLTAPKELLRFLNIHVVGNITGNLDDEVFLLFDEQGAPELIVCAVPYLRDRDVRTSEEGETSDLKIQKTVDGIRDHYAQVAARAEGILSRLGKKIPVAAMGHLFAAGGQTIEGDGVREVSVGSLAQVRGDVFSPTIDYAALGHLHVPQIVGGMETRRYSGSPIPMGFGEAAQTKTVVVVDFQPPSPVIRTVLVPRFQELAQLRGDWKAISAQIAELSKRAAPVWLEIIYDGDDVLGKLAEHINAAVSDTALSVLSVKDLRRTSAMLSAMHAAESLEELTEEDIFRRCLTANNIPEANGEGLLATFREAVAGMHAEDVNAE